MANAHVIDLNCDLGEGAGNDALLMPLITSVNIACGAHAGDAVAMRTTVRLARLHGVVIGAHPGFADRAFFGRRDLGLTPGEITRLVIEQVGVLQQICAEESAQVRYVKPHGALYNMAARDEAVAAAIVEGVALVNPCLGLVGLAGSRLLASGCAKGLHVASEVFADRSYQADGSLTPRSQSDGVLGSESMAVEQVMQMIRLGTVRAINGAAVRIQADTVCLHGDGANAVEFARSLQAAFVREGVCMRPFFS